MLTSSVSHSQHDDVKSLFYNPDAPADKRIARVSTNHDHHQGSLIFKDKKVDRILTPATSDTDDEDEPLRQKLPFGSLGLSGPSSAGLPVFAAPAPVDLHPEGTPKTLDDLLDILRQHRPGKKIIEIAGDIDIKETFVTTAIIHVHGIGPARRALTSSRSSSGLADRLARLRRSRPRRLVQASSEQPHHSCAPGLAARRQQSDRQGPTVRPLEGPSSSETNLVLPFRETA